MSSVITIDDESQIAYIQKRLGALSDQAPKVLARAINDTAKQARKACRQGTRNLRRKDGPF